MKRTYSIDAPDQARLKVARTEIEAVLRKHDLAGVVVLVAAIVEDRATRAEHTPAKHVADPMEARRQ